MKISFAKLWSILEIRVLLVGSLIIQISLLFLAGFRKRVMATRMAQKHNFTWWGPLGRIFHGILWLAYLLADYVATVALAFLRDSKDRNGKHLLIFWAPFFLVHLGGQDTITALSIEDNELWARHLVTLVTQAALALYNYFMSNLHVNDLWPPAALMFTVGCLKYIERIWALERASMSALRSSMITKPDPGPNYAKFMQEYTSSIYAGLEAEIKIEVERHKGDDHKSKEIFETKDDNESKKFEQRNKNVPDEHSKKEIENKTKDDNESKKSEQTNKNVTDEHSKKEIENKTKEVTKAYGFFSRFKHLFVTDEYSKKDIENEKEYSEIVTKAYEFFPRFKRLFVDLILSYKDREDSQKYFRNLNFTSAYKLIEIELTWMYDILHSKAAVFYSITYYGWASRAFTLLASITSLVLFATGQHEDYRPYDVALTYMLLGAAVGLEAGAVAFMVTSFWTYAVMKEYPGWRQRLADCLFRQQIWWHPMKKASWSNKMAQFSLIKYSLLDKPYWWKSAMDTVGFKQSWDHYRYTTYFEVSENLKELVFTGLKNKLNDIGDKDGYKRFTEHRGQWALQRKGYYKEFAWSVEAEFDESVLLWHIATDLLFHKEFTKDDNSESMRISEGISNYMMFLMIARPFMMPAGIGQIRFGDSSAEAKNFLEQQQARNIMKEAATMILGVNTDYAPADIKGDRSKSVLFDGCRLAHQLQKEFEHESKRMWTLISQVWVEMLCYAASKCSGQYHAKQLSKGGELLTVVWYLMAHLGMGEQYRIEQGHARAKLIVSK